jgi:hypothetical protein
MLSLLLSIVIMPQTSTKEKEYSISHHSCLLDTKKEEDKIKQKHHLLKR